VFILGKDIYNHKNKHTNLYTYIHACIYIYIYIMRVHSENLLRSDRNTHAYITHACLPHLPTRLGANILCDGTVVYTEEVTALEKQRMLHG